MLPPSTAVVTGASCGAPDWVSYSSVTPSHGGLVNCVER